MFFLLAGIPFGIFALRVILKIITGLSILNTLMGWSDSLSDYYKARVKGTDVTDGHLETHLFGVDVQAIEVDMEQLKIERDPSKKRMDYNGQEITEKEKAGCISNIDAVIKRLEGQGKKVGKVCYFLDKKNKTIIFIDRRGNETVAIEIPLERSDLQDTEQAAWNVKIEAILAMDSKGKALDESQIEAIDALLIGFGADTCKVRTQAAENNAKEFIQSKDVSKVDRAKVEYLLKALQEMQALQVEAVKKQSIAQGEIDKIRGDNFGVMDKARSFMAAFDSTMDKYVDKAVTAVGKGFDRKDDGFFEYVTYLVEVAKFESGVALDGEIAIQKTQAEAESKGVSVIDSSGAEQDGWEQETWYQQGLAGKLESYKEELEKHRSDLDKEEQKIPVAAHKPEKLGIEVFKSLFSGSSAKNTAKNKEKTKEAIQKRKKAALPISLFERFKRFFSSVFRPTPHMSIRALFLGEKVSALGDTAVETQFEREETFQQQKKDLDSKIKQVGKRIETVKSIQTQVKKLEETVSKETIEVYDAIEDTRKANTRLEEEAKEKSGALAKLSDTIKPLDDIGAKVKENSERLPYSAGSEEHKIEWAELEGEEQSALSGLSKSYDEGRLSLVDQLSSLEKQVSDARDSSQAHKLDLQEQKEKLEKVDDVNQAILPLGARSVVNQICDEAFKAISTIQGSIKEVSAKMEEAKKNIKIAAKEVVVNTAIALLHEEAKVSIVYTGNLRDFVPKVGEIAVAYDAASKRFLFKYLKDDAVISESIENMDESGIKALIIFLNNQTPENKEKLFEIPAFSKFRDAHNKVLSERQEELRVEEAANKAKIEAHLAEESNLEKSSDEIMKDLADKLSAEEGQTLGQKLRSLIGEENGNGAARLRELQIALDKLNKQKEDIEKLKQSINLQREQLEKVEKDTVAASALKESLEVYQIGQLQNQVRLSAIRVGSAMSQLKLRMKEVGIESQHNPFFSKEDKEKLRQTVLQAKRTANRAGMERVFAMLDDGTDSGKKISEQLQAEFKDVDWSAITDQQVDTVVDRVEEYVNTGVDIFLDGIDGLKSQVGEIVEDAKVTVGLQSEHQAYANALQVKIDKAVTIFDGIEKQEQTISEVTQQAQKRKETADKLIDEIDALVQASSIKREKAIEDHHSLDLTRVYDCVKRAEKSEVSAKENAELLIGKESIESAAKLVETATAAAVEAKECISADGQKVVSLDKAEAAAKKSEEASGAVIALVRTETQEDVRKAKQNQKRASAALDSARSSLNIISVIEIRSKKQGLVDFNTSMSKRLITASQFLRQCEESQKLAGQNLDSAEIAMRTLQDDRLKIKELREEISLSLQNIEVLTIDSETMAAEIEKIAQESLKECESLIGGKDTSYVHKRKLNFKKDAAEHDGTLVSASVSAEQKIVEEMRAVLEKTLNISRKEVEKISDVEIKSFADKLEKAYKKGDYDTIVRLHEKVSQTGGDIDRYYRTIMVALAMEQACYMLLAKAEIFEAVHRYLKNEITAEEMQKIIVTQEGKIERADDVVNNLSSFTVEGIELYDQEFLSLLSDLKCIQADVDAYKKTVNNPFADKKEWYELAAEEVMARQVSFPISPISADNPFENMSEEEVKKWNGIAVERQKVWADKNPSTLFQNMSGKKSDGEERKGLFTTMKMAAGAFLANAATWISTLFESGGGGIL